MLNKKKETFPTGQNLSPPSRFFEMNYILSPPGHIEISLVMIKKNIKKNEDEEVKIKDEKDEKSMDKKKKKLKNLPVNLKLKTKANQFG